MFLNSQGGAQSTVVVQSHLSLPQNVFQLNKCAVFVWNFLFCHFDKAER